MAKTAGVVIINLRYSLSLIFVAIAILICYSTIERLIREQSVLIGTKKSLGMKRSELRAYYSTFSLMAVLTGVAIGTALGMLVIQPVVYSMTEENFVMTAKTPYFSVFEYLLITLAELVLIMLATLITVDKIVKKDAISLINDINQKSNKTHFYEKSAFYKRLSLIYKTMLNNIFSDWKRCVATFLSVAGCTVLIACSLFMNHSISSSVDSQFEKYYHFNDMVYIDTQVETAEKDVADILAKKKVPYAELYQTSGLVSKGKNPASYVGYYVPKDESFYDVVDLETTKGKKISNVKGDYLSEAFMNEYKLSSGDKVRLKDNQGNEITAKIDQAFKYYLISNQMVISRKTFEKLSGEKYQTNTFFIDTTGVDRKALQKELAEVDGFSSYSKYREESVDRVKTFTNAAKAVVIVYLLLSVVMALLVVLNLLNMYVMEKKREIIVLMINGYEKNPIRKYIFSDTILISIIGIIAGDIIGTAMGTIVTGTFITADMTFSLAPYIPVCLLGIGIAGVIVLATVLISMRKMNAFRLTDM